MSDEVSSLNLAELLWRNGASGSALCVLARSDDQSAARWFLEGLCDVALGRREAASVAFRRASDLGELRAERFIADTSNEKSSDESRLLMRRVMPGKDGFRPVEEAFDDYSRDRLDECTQRIAELRNSGEDQRFLDGLLGLVESEREDPNWDIAEKYLERGRLVCRQVSDALAEHYVDTGRFDDAERVWLEAVELAEFFDFSIKLGNFYLDEREDYEAAERWYWTGLGHGDINCSLNLAEMFENNFDGREQEAFALYLLGAAQGDVTARKRASERRNKHGV